MRVNETGAFIFRSLREIKDKEELNIFATAIQNLLDKKEPLDIKSIKAKIGELRGRVSKGESIGRENPNKPIKSGPKT